MVKHTTFYRGHRIELAHMVPRGQFYERGEPHDEEELREAWFYRIEGRACYSTPDTPFAEDYEAHEAATQVIDSEIAEMEGLSNAPR